MPCGRMLDTPLALGDHSGPLRTRPVMELGDWLRSLGLERYEAVFRENAIDPDVLCDLTEEHLRELGVPLGARLKLLKAIAALAAGKEPSGPTAGTEALDPQAMRSGVMSP